MTRPNAPAVSASAIAAATWLLAACGGLNSATIDEVSGLRCVDDSPPCVAARQRALSALRSDPQRAWVRGPSDPRTYAAGVRLFAFRLEKEKLTCDQLAIGVREAQRAPEVLKGSRGKMLTPAQASRGLMLSAEVKRDLERERNRRC